MWFKKKDHIQKIKNKIKSLKVSLFVEQLKLQYYIDLDKIK